MLFYLEFKASSFERRYVRCGDVRPTDMNRLSLNKMTDTHTHTEREK